MKIQGQDLRDVFRMLPWQYKIVVAVGAVFILFISVYVPTHISKISISKASGPAPLHITASRYRPVGIFDPSLAYDPVSKAVWMAYASEEASQKAGSESMVHVRIAASSDRECKSWTQTDGGFEAKQDDILAPDGQTVFRSGAWRVETPSIIYDPDDRGREWKLYAYKYFWSKDPVHRLKIAQHYGMIVYKYSADPAKGWSTEQWLFSPGPDYPPVPYEQMILLHLNRLDPSLRDIITYSRPSVIYKDGVLMMTLSAFTEGAAPDRIIMIISRDHGNSWLYAGAPLKTGDLAGIGPYTKLSGATLLEQNGQVYLAAVLGDVRQQGKGTFIFSFDDPLHGTLRRNPETGVPVILNQLPLRSLTPGGMGGGFAAYSDACPFGLLTGEQTVGGATFQIFKTYKKPSGD